MTANASTKSDPQGILVTLLQEVAAREGWVLDYRVCEPVVCLEQLAAGEIDLLPGVVDDELLAWQANWMDEPRLLVPIQFFYAVSAAQDPALLITLDHHLQAWQSEEGSPYQMALQAWVPRTEAKTATPSMLVPLLSGLALLGAVAAVVALVLRLLVKRRTQHLQNLNEHLRHQAHYDPLTDLPNRTLLTARLKQMMQQVLDARQWLAVVFIDLDNFQQINDRYGLEVGDELLAALSKRLRNAVPLQDLVGRMGGDEFVVVMAELPDQVTGRERTEFLLRQLAQPVQLGELTLRLSASIGLCFYPEQGGMESDQLLRQANQAMYQAKQTGKNAFQVFDAEWDRRIRGQHELLERVRQALGGNEFELYYQPKINLRSSQVIGVEALIRWHHPERGLLPPAAFLPLVEEQPLDAALGYWVLESALSQMSRWQRDGMQVSVSVNVSAWHLRQPNFISRLQLLLGKYSEVPPSRLELEVLESSALDDIRAVSSVMRDCAGLGVKFALDDFGTGYSTLTYLRRLPAQLLKIDQSFVRNMLHDEEDLAILEGVIRLAAAFQRQVIAEGVETRRHGEKLLSLGCELAQGYGIARPMPASALPAWIRNWQRTPAWTA